VARARSRQKRSAPITELTNELEQCIPSPSDTPGQVDGAFLIELVGRFLRSLPEEQRNMFIRRYWYLDPVKEVAAFFGCSQGRVKTTLYRVRRDLREYLIKEGYDI
jgi:RNA polymerase sigma-70 factor (ECF subfamily)